MKRGREREGREGGYVVNAPLSDAPGARWNMRHAGLLARLPLYFVMIYRHSSDSNCQLEFENILLHATLWHLQTDSLPDWVTDAINQVLERLN